MGRITIHLHGAPKEKPCGELIDMYVKRLTVKGFKLEIHSSKKSLEQYFADINDGSNVILLDERGAHYDSVEFADKVNAWQINSRNTNIAIGPVDGWKGVWQNRQINLLSLSKMTFPHELASVMLLEQLYRATQIASGSNYHRS